jgi:ATP/maltotriose-dependent transcriptional regulator MalT
LLTDWVRHGDARVAWLTLAPADAEPRRFWRLLESALHEDDAAQLVVVIDDAHLLTHPSILEGLDGTGPLRAAEFGIASSAIAAVFADTDSAVRQLRRLSSVKSDRALTEPDLLVSSDLVELVLGQKAFDAGAVDAAAHRLLGRSNDVSVPLQLGLRAAVLLAQASIRLWYGRYEDVAVILDEALTEAQRDGMPGLELEALSMVALVDSIWSRTTRADEGDLYGGARALRRILLPDVVGADSGLEVALKLGRARVLLAEGQAYRARLALRDLGHHIPPVLAVQRDAMLADLDTSLAASRCLPEPLTQREPTILRFLGTGVSTTEIADELHLSVNTVQTQLANICRKLAVSRRREAVLRARELELI